MPRTSAQRSLFFVMLIVAGLIAFILNASNGVTKDEANGQIRMAVDPNVLPVLQPDGTEASATKIPEPAPVDQAMTEPKTPAVPEAQPPAVVPDQPVAKPAPEQKPTPAPTLAPTAKPATGIIKSISLNETGTGFTVTIVANRPIGDTTYMNLSNPRRLVIDLRELWTAKIRNVIRAKSGPAKHIVLGSHPDRLRLVVHFRTPPAKKLTPRFERKGNTLTVSVPIP